jgi:hypothetical protein
MLGTHRMPTALLTISGKVASFCIIILHDYPVCRGYTLTRVTHGLDRDLVPLTHDRGLQREPQAISSILALTQCMYRSVMADHRSCVLRPHTC